MSQQISKKLTVKNHSGQKAYAESTLVRKYRNIGLPKTCIDLLHTYLIACANFYQIIDVETAWRSVKKVTGEKIAKAPFYELISIDARNMGINYMVFPESYFYDDGDPDESLIVSPGLLLAYNEDFTQKDAKKLKAYIRKHGATTGYTGEMPIIFDMTAFDDLYNEKLMKPDYYVPKDLMDYASLTYYTHNAKTEALKNYLIEELEDSPDDAEEKTSEIVNFIRDSREDPLQNLHKVLRLAAGMDPYESEDEAVDLDLSQLQELTPLYMDLCNHIYLPSNNGFTPKELNRRYVRVERPQSIHFGKGFRDAIARGDIDPDEFKSDLITDDDLLPSMKNILLNGFDQVEQNIKTDKKVGRNDPCPCGSGKKYKKCCGR